MLSWMIALHRRNQKNKYGFSYNEYIEITKDKCFSYKSELKKFQHSSYWWSGFWVAGFVLLTFAAALLGVVSFPSILDIEMMSKNSIENDWSNRSIIYIPHLVNGDPNFKTELSVYAYIIFALFAFGFVINIFATILMFNYHSPKKWQNAFFIQYYQIKYYQPQDDKLKNQAILWTIIFHILMVVSGSLCIYYSTTASLNGLRDVIAHQIKESYRYLWFNIPGILGAAFMILFLSLSIIPCNILSNAYLLKYLASIVDIYKDEVARRNQITNI